MPQFNIIDLGQIYDNQDRWRQNALNGRIQQMQMQEMQKQIRNRNALNEALTAGWKPEQSVTTPAPGNYDTSEGGDIPPPTVTKTPGGFDMQAIQAELVKRGLGSEALNFQMQQDAANKELRKLQMEYMLKDALQSNNLARAQAIFKEMAGVGQGGYGTSFEVGPQGPKFGFDPSKAAETRMKEAELRDKGVMPTPSPVNPRGGAGAVQPTPVTPGISPAQQREINAKNAEAEAKNARISKSLLDNIGLAEVILQKASGSVGGSAINAAKGMFGISNEKTKANEQLKLISGWMVSNVPRMEGPQSNFDVLNYKTMAANVGDSTKPIGDRLAALKTLRSLQEKYSSNQAAPVGRFLGFE